MLFKICFIVSILFTIRGAYSKYAPNWTSLDSRPLPKWYDAAKIGIFMHWGVYSVPAYGAGKMAGEWFWTYWKGSPQGPIAKYMKDNYPPNFEYADFAPQFHAELFNENEWADLISKSGARYYVLTSKHHEGFCNWPTKYSFNWNSGEVGPNTDLVGRMATAIRKRTNVTFGLYHSLYEWYNPLYMNDKKNNFKTQEFVNMKVIPALKEVIELYKPAVIWSDGDWEALPEYWTSLEFLAWLYNESPVKDVVVTNDRWGSGTLCKHGGYLTCSDRYEPNHLIKRKWEMCAILDKYSWGYRREMRLEDVLSMQELLQKLVRTVSLGGNFLLNIGPRSDGTIAPIFKERLLQMGSWLQINGDAIYSSQPWIYQIDSVTPRTWYTMNNNKIYCIYVQDNIGDVVNIKLGLFNTTSEWKINNIRILGFKDAVTFKVNDKFSLISFNNIYNSNNAQIFKWAFTMEISATKK